MRDRKDAGHHEVLWNGRNENGRLVPSGVYFYRIKAGDYVEISVFRPGVLVVQVVTKASTSEEAAVADQTATS